MEAGREGWCRMPINGALEDYYSMSSCIYKDEVRRAPNASWVGKIIALVAVVALGLLFFFGSVSSKEHYRKKLTAPGKSQQKAHAPRAASPLDKLR